MTVEFYGVPSHTCRITNPKNGVYVNSNEASAWSTALSMSSGSYSRLAMQELVYRKIKELMAAPKVSSSGKTEQYVIPQVI
jgi:hypothetical protein